MNRIKKTSLIFLCLFCFQTAKAEWVRQDVGTMAWLRTVYFVNENTGWIGGSNGTFLKTTDGGKHWQQASNFTSDSIREIYFSDNNNGWILCERDIYSLGANSPSYLMKTKNGGADWEPIEFKSDKRERIAKIFFTKNGLGLAVGEAGAFFIMQNDEKTWKKQALPIHYLLLDGTFTDDFHGALVGAGGNIIFTEDAGLTWNKATIYGEPKAKLNSVFFVNQKNGWTVGERGKIFQTINGGKIWREQISGVLSDLNDIFFVNTAEGWAIGSDGLILHTTTGGNVWTINESKVRHKLEKIYFTEKSGWAVGFGGTILRYNKASEIFSKTTPILQKRN